MIDYLEHISGLLLLSYALYTMISATYKNDDDTNNAKGDGEGKGPRKRNE